MTADRMYKFSQNIDRVPEQLEVIAVDSGGDRVPAGRHRSLGFVLKRLGVVVSFRWCCGTDHARNIDRARHEVGGDD